MLSLLQYKTRKEAENGWRLSDSDWVTHYRQYTQGYDSIPLPPLTPTQQGAVTRERASQALIIERARREELDRLARISEDTKRTNKFAEEQIHKEAQREHELLAKTDEEERKSKLAVCAQFYGQFRISEWPAWVREYYVNEWKNKYAHMTRKNKYDALLSNSYEPWSHINNCTEKTPPNPSDAKENQFDIDMYYDHIMPECGMELEWYNTPFVNLGPLGSIERTRRGIKFAPSIAAEVGIGGRKIANAASDAADKLKWPAFFSGTVAIFIAVAIVAIKLL
jgi:hypothetical protein